MLDAFTIVSPVRDPDGEIIDFRYRYVNDAYCALVGFDRERLLGHRSGRSFRNSWTVTGSSSIAAWP